MFRRAPKAAAIAATVALAACGSGTPTVVPPPPPGPPTPPPTTVPPAPATLADLSAAVSSRQAGEAMSCDGEVRALVMLTNRAASSVAVQGILKRTGITAGRCFPASDFVYTPLRRLVSPNSTQAVLDRVLYNGGVGCCQGRGCGSSCRIQESFEVITEVGHVPAGDFTYQVFYQNCPSCLRVSAATDGTCPPIPAEP